MMNFEEALAVTQERLLGEADSMGALLEGLRNLISPALIGETEWQDLLEVARELPSTMAAFPFGFELSLNERRPRADLGLSVVGGTGPAAFFEEKARSENAGTRPLRASRGCLLNRNPTTPLYARSPAAR